jgi:hypothetical protein
MVSLRATIHDDAAPMKKSPDSSSNMPAPGLPHQVLMAAQGGASVLFLSLQTAVLWAMGQSFQDLPSLLLGLFVRGIPLWAALHIAHRADTQGRRQRATGFAVIFAALSPVLSWLALTMGHASVMVEGVALLLWLWVGKVVGAPEEAGMSEEEKT